MGDSEFDLESRLIDLRERMHGEHMYYPDLPCWCGGIPAFGTPHVTFCPYCGRPDCSGIISLALCLAPVRFGR